MMMFPTTRHTLFNNCIGNGNNDEEDSWGSDMEMEMKMLLMMQSNNDESDISDNDNGNDNISVGNDHIIIENNISANARQNQMQKQIHSQRRKRILHVPPEWLDPYAPLPTDAEFSRWIRTQLAALPEDCNIGVDMDIGTATSSADNNGVFYPSPLSQLVNEAIARGSSLVNRSTQNSNHYDNCNYKYTYTTLLPVYYGYKTQNNPFQGVELAQRTF